MNVIILDSNFVIAAEIAAQICALEDFSVTNILSTSEDLSKLNLENSILLFKLTSIENYDKDFAIIDELVCKISYFKVFLISDCATKDLILKTYENNFSGIIESEYFLQNLHSILKIFEAISGFYISPLTSKIDTQEKISKVVFSKYLSKQQNAVAFYLVKGNKYTEIASFLGLSLNTVRMHVKLIYKKLNVTSKYQLMYALDNENVLMYKNTLYDYGVELDNLAPKLTSKELSILSFLKEGKSPKDISRELSITLNTTRYHIRKLKSKSALKAL